MAIEHVNLVHNNKKVKLGLPEGTGNVGKKLRGGRFYEQKFLNYISSLHIDGTYVDVGANIGNHSIFFSLFTDAQHVVSIEANPPTAEVLRHNVEINKLKSKITIYEMAAGDHVGMVGMKILPSDVIGGSQVIEGNDVEMKRIDDLELNDVSVMKIDVEGSEMGVLRGSSETIDKYKPEIFIEATTAENYNNIHGYLQKYGYKEVVAYNNSATYHFSARFEPQSLNFITRHYPLRRILRNS